MPQKPDCWEIYKAAKVVVAGFGLDNYLTTRASVACDYAARNLAQGLKMAALAEAKVQAAWQAGYAAQSYLNFIRQPGAIR